MTEIPKDNVVDSDFYAGFKSLVTELPETDIVFFESLIILLDLKSTKFIYFWNAHKDQLMEEFNNNELLPNSNFIRRSKNIKNNFLFIKEILDFIESQKKEGDLNGN
jgi:hypothetical protein